MTIKKDPTVFYWNGKKMEKLDVIIETALKLKGKEQAEFVEGFCAMGPYARQNIGYCSGYYDAKTAKRIMKVFSTAPPIFGTMTNIAPEAAFEMGWKLGKSSRAK